MTENNVYFGFESYRPGILTPTQLQKVISQLPSPFRFTHGKRYLVQTSPERYVNPLCASQEIPDDFVVYEFELRLIVDENGQPVKVWHFLGDIIVPPKVER
jgi:hypothetical protein